MGKWTYAALVAVVCAFYDIAHGQLLAMQVALFVAVITLASGDSETNDNTDERRNEYNPATGSPMASRGRGGVDMSGSVYGSRNEP